MRAAWWWIDRWRQSTAYTDMTAEEQGLYRNLLDEVWLRDDHVIPDDPRILAKVSGDPEAWMRCSNRVLGWMTRVETGWTHTTAMEVIEQSRRRAENQKRYRNRRNNTSDNATDNKPDSPSQSQSNERLRTTDSGDATRPGPKRTRKLPVESASAVKEACEDWTDLLGGTAPGSRIAGAWPGLLRLAPWSDVRPVWRWYLAEGKSAGKAEFCNPQDFASKYEYWKARALGVVDPDAWKRGRQPQESAVEANARVLEAVEQGRL